MAGSFESGAGDLDDIFENEDDREEGKESEDESEGEEKTEQEVAGTQRTGREKLDPNDNQGQASATSPSTDSQDSDQEGPTDDVDTGSESVSVEFETGTDFDAARLAREFVPKSYDKPHAWALGRNGVNDGRPEKKTFFLQEQILRLEEECRSEVNEILEGDVPLTDMRELALIIAYHHPQRIAEAAREWGSESA